MGVTECYDRYLKRHSVHRRRGTRAIAQHLIVGVSASYFDDPADRHDPESPAVRTLLRHATEWAETAIGGVIHARYDVDETGDSIVDVIAVPTRVDKRTGKRWISHAAPQRNLRAKWKQQKGYAAYQDDWAAFVTERTGREFLRGIPKKDSGREHLVAEVYGEGQDEIARLKQENARLRNERSAMRKALDAGKARLGAVKGQLSKVLAQIAEARRERAQAQREAEAARRNAEAAQQAAAEARRAIENAMQERDRALRERDDARASLKNTGNRLARIRRSTGAFSRRLTAWTVGILRAASRPRLPPDPEPEGELSLAEEAQGIAATMAHVSEPTAKTAEHARRIRKHVRDKLTHGGWEKSDPQAPLYALYEAEGSPTGDSSDDPYFDWRLDLAHSSGRARAVVERAKLSGYAPADLRDCLRLARRLERGEGRYLSRKERRQAVRLPLHDSDEARRGSAPAGFSR